MIIILTFKVSLPPRILVAWQSRPSPKWVFADEAENVGLVQEMPETPVPFHFSSPRPFLPPFRYMNILFDFFLQL